jgi:FAD/FMN-containing dehydrogenase
MVPIFQNGSCDPFHSPDTPCTLGNMVEYTVKATQTEHVQAAVRFAAAHNIRLVVKNTGHDFLGRSTGPAALGLWTHHLNWTAFIEDYNGPAYSGPAMKLGAGTQGWQAYQDAHAHGYRVLGGTCPTVGLVGGYAQGGGHGALTSMYGLLADNILEWEVITADGSLIRASSEEHADLYWALCGGGAGAFGIVVSLTTKLFPEGLVTGAQLVFNRTSDSAFWDSTSVLQAGATELVDTGAVLIVGITNSTVNAYITAPAVSAPGLQEQLQYITSHLDAQHIPFSLAVQTDASYFDHFARYFGPLPHGIWPVSHLMGSRLLPRSLFRSSSKKKQLRDIGRSITADNEWAISAVILNSHGLSHRGETEPATAVLPAWDDALVHYTVYSSWDWGSDAEMQARSDRLTDEIIPSMTKLSPQSGIYANEANYRQDDWSEEFFGAHWVRLSQIKQRWDPRGVFYSRLGPGADLWVETSDRRLCQLQVSESLERWMDR